MSDCCPNGCEDEDKPCVQECQSKCEWKNFPGGNHINWKIAHDDDGDDTRTMTADTCKYVLESLVFNECKDYGGEQTYGGFYWKADPNPGTCAQGW